MRKTFPYQTLKENQRIKISVASSSDRNVIYKIRHDVYGSELQQHKQNERGILKDQLDDFNIYFVAKIQEEIVGFISVTPPKEERYSIDKYISRADYPFQVDGYLYEMRILTVVRKHRKKPIAILLMQAAFRWIEAGGGKKIMAIGRLEVLDMYLKLGFKAIDQRIRSGSVDFELLYGDVSELNLYIDKNYKELFTKLYTNCIWDLDISFFKPASCYHGGAFFDAIGVEFDNLYKRENIINADVLDAWFPPSPKIINILENHLSWICRTSPPTDCIGMINIIARTRGVMPENILPGAGSSNLIFLAFREWLTPDSRVLILDPTYGEYMHVLENIIKCSVDRFTVSANDGYKVNLEKLILVSQNKYDLIVLVNPNSPTGQHVPRENLEKAISVFPNETRVWVDETYVEYVGANQSLEKFAVNSHNVIVCKSMSKVYALSGLRDAYLCGSPVILEFLKSISPPWAVSLPAQIAAVFALQDHEYYNNKYKETHILRDKFVTELRELNFREVINTQVNFILCHLFPDGNDAATLVSKCREKGLYIRDVSNMGTGFNNRTIRIAIKDHKTNTKILKILKSLLV